MRAFQQEIKTLPKTKEQNPGKFAREYFDPKNRDTILKPMKESEEMEKFKRLIEAMDPVRITVDKSEPTEEDRKNFSEYAKTVQKAMNAFTWGHVFASLPEHLH